MASTSRPLRVALNTLRSTFHHPSFASSTLPSRPNTSTHLALASSHSLRFATTSSSSSSSKAPSGPPRDEEIPFQQVILVDPASSSLLAPAPLRLILSQLDRERFYLTLVDPTKGICKIIDRKQQWEKAKEQRIKKASSSKGVAGPGEKKEVHLSWGVSSHDLGHKLKKGKDMLEKGYKVGVVVANKKGADKMAQAQREQVLKIIEAEMTKEGKVKLVRKKGVKGLEGAVEMEFANV